MHSTRVEDFRLEDWLPYWISPDDLIAALEVSARFGMEEPGEPLRPRLFPSHGNSFPGR